MKRAEVLRIAAIVFDSGIKGRHSMDMELFNGNFDTYVKVWIWKPDEEGKPDLVDNRDFHDFTEADEAWLYDWADKIREESDEADGH